MDSIANYQNKMTVYYNKNNGYIINILGGIQDLNIFGDKKIEYEVYADFIVIDKDVNKLRKYNNYKMDLMNNVLVEKTHEELNPYDINKSKDELISSSKFQLTNYLQNNPLLFSDGKYYSVTQEKQNLLNNAITVYQMKSQLGLPAELKWNSTGEECSVWTLEDAISLALGVASYVEPLVAYQQSIEVQIRNCTTREELESIVIDYATV